METLFIVLLVILGFIYVLPFLFRLMAPFLMKKAMEYFMKKTMGPMAGDPFRSNHREGEINIDTRGTPKKGPKPGNNQGEYVDFEEIK